MSTVNFIVRQEVGKDKVGGKKKKTVYAFLVVSSVSNIL